MDLLQGYGSDDSSSSSSPPSPPPPPTSAKSVPAVAPSPELAAISSVDTSAMKKAIGPSKEGKGGKKFLSLAAVLPPEIWDRLTKGDEGTGESSESGEEGAAKSGKKRKRTSIEGGGVGGAGGDGSVIVLLKENSAGASTTGDRPDLNSLLNELRSTPLHVGIVKSKPSMTQHHQGKSEGGKKEKLGFSLMTYTTSTTTKSAKGGNKEVVDIHASRTSGTSNTTKLIDPELSDSSSKEKSNAAQTATCPAKRVPENSSILFTRMSAAAPMRLTSYSPSAASGSLSSAPTSLSHASISMPEYPTSANQTDSYNEYQHNNNYSHAAPTNSTNNPNNNASMTKSRKQKREEEHALRSGTAFESSIPTMATEEVHQPSPQEFAPTAHAAAIASRAARYRGLGQLGSGADDPDYADYQRNESKCGGRGGVGMYDPKTGGVKSTLVTAKHRSKHQINQLMASAISLEAHRAADAELARFGGEVGGGGTGRGASNSGGKGGGRTDAKRKYGW